MTLASPDAGLIDAATLLSVCGHRQDLLTRMTGSLATHAPRHLADAGIAIRQRDAVRLQECAHRLRGLLSAFSAAAGDAAAELQQMGAEQRLERVGERHQSLAGLVQSLCAALAGVTLEDLERLQDGGDGQSVPLNANRRH